MTDYWLWEFIETNSFGILVLWVFVFAVLKILAGKKKVPAWAIRGFLGVSLAVYAFNFVAVTLLYRRPYQEYQYELSLLWEYRLAFCVTEHGIAIESRKWMFEIINNILLFVPAGMMYGEFSRKESGKTALILGAGISLAVEVCQLIFKLGLFEFDDILNNTIGMMIGYAIYAIVAKFADSA